MAWDIRDDIVQDSSSGGLFSSIAERVLEYDGVVVGVGYGMDNKTLQHIIIRNKGDLYKIRKSKYYQSDSKDIYNNVLIELRKGKSVCFSGTACQNKALINYLNLNKVSTEKLLLVDVLCHGVTSSKVVNSYLEYYEQKNHSLIQNYSFRTKEGKYGWQDGNGTRMKLVFKNNNTFINNKLLDSFFMGFNNNIFLRESCYTCPFAGRERISDFTLADLWGIDDASLENICSLTQDQIKKRKWLGASLVLINTIKAKNFFDSLEKIKRFPITIDDFSKNNKALIEPNSRPSTRNAFFSRLNKNENYNKIIHSICRRQYLRAYVVLLLGEKRYLRIMTTIHKIIK